MAGFVPASCISFDGEFVVPWQMAGGFPLEYIESSSPLPGGGVVSGRFGQQAPSDGDGSGTRSGNSVLVRDAASDASTSRSSSNGICLSVSQLWNSYSGYNAPATPYPQQNYYTTPVARRRPAFPFHGIVRSARIASAVARTRRMVRPFMDRQVWQACNHRQQPCHRRCRMLGGIRQAVSRNFQFAPLNSVTNCLFNCRTCNPTLIQES